MKLNEIETYINTLIEDELNFKNSGWSTETKPDAGIQPIFFRFIRFFNLLLFSIFDFARLYLKVRFNKNSLKNKRFVYTARNFCNLVDGKLVDRVVKPLFTDNIIFINPSKEILLDEINGQKVYNLGVLVKFLSFFYRDRAQFMCYFKAYSLVNNAIIKRLERHEVYVLWFYNLNSLSLIFSAFRQNICLIEVQHGSMVNYPPYSKSAPVKIADVFYVKNQPTIEYLKTHLCLNFPAEYRLIPYPRQKRGVFPGFHMLYASTVEFNGLHPVMQKFLAKIRQDDFHLIIRLHPRERDKEFLFIEQMTAYKVNYQFDRSENWLEGNNIFNLIVVSPWSSTIEDAYDNGFQTIIIDPVGRERYQHLIDNQRCFYSDNLSQTFSGILLET